MLEAARGFTIETITHGWDLAVATGQRPVLAVDPFRLWDGGVIAHDGQPRPLVVRPAIRMTE